MSVTILPTFKGHTVDMRLREFRIAIYPEKLEFIPFDSPEGQKILRELLSFAFEIIKVAKEILDKSQAQSNGHEQGEKSGTDFKKIELFHLCDSPDNYFRAIEPGLRDIDIQLADIKIGLMAARKLSQQIQKELGFREDADK